MLLRAILTGSTQSPPLMPSRSIIFGKARSLDRIRRFLLDASRTSPKLRRQPEEMR